MGEKRERNKKKEKKGGRNQVYAHTKNTENYIWELDSGAAVKGNCEAEPHGKVTVLWLETVSRLGLYTP